MTKPIITAEQFNDFPLVDGVRKCPTGDYSQIPSFENCEFESNCIFAAGTKFNCCVLIDWNMFGRACQFYACYFGSENSFAAACDFTGFCSFQHGNHFDLGAVFRSRCLVGNNNTFRGGACFEAQVHFGGGNWFGDGCQFGPASRFGDDCQFGSNCVFERGIPVKDSTGYTAKPGYPFLALMGAGSSNRTTYFYNTTEGVIVRSGCFLGTVEQFCDKVMQDVKGDYNHPKAVEYISMAKLAIASFKARGG